MLALQPSPTTTILPSAQKINELALVEGIMQGNKQAIDTLYNAYAGALYGIIHRIIKAEDEAKDILQDTFVKIWKCIKQYDPTKGRLFTWMANVARNLSIDFVRSKYYKNSCQNDDLHETQQHVERSFNFSINPELLDIRRFVENLKVNQKALIVLIYFKGYTQQEAADELNIPIGTVKTRIRLSMIALRKYFN